MSESLKVYKRQQQCFNNMNVLNNYASISFNFYEGMKTVAATENIYAKIANKLF